MKMDAFLPVLLLALAWLAASRPFCEAAEDPYLAYEKIDAPEAIAWIRRQNARTMERLAGDPRFQEFFDYNLAQLDAKDRIAYPSFYRDSDAVRNFWRDEAHPQGVIRETDVSRFFSGDHRWETVLDLDALSREEGRTWVYGGSSYPHRDHTRAMITLSDGGKDAGEIREFDYVRRRFVEDGFFLPESKSAVDWLDSDTLLVASAMEGDVTTSGYPRVVRLWRRGTPFAGAEEVFSCAEDDLSVVGWLGEIDDGVTRVFYRLAKDFYHQEYHVTDADGAVLRVRIPADARLMGFHRRLAFVLLRSDWDAGRLFKAGSVVTIPFDELAADEQTVTLFYEPPVTASVSGLASTRDYVYLSLIENVQSRIIQYELRDDGWATREVPLGAMVDAAVQAAPWDKGFILYQDLGLLTPQRLLRLDERTFDATPVQSLPQRFDPADYTARQEFAVSADGTRVPYFIVHRRDLEANGRNPVELNGYGGFMVSETPAYVALTEFSWLRHGGVYVVANIRGGGEYGPSWHAQAQKKNRHKAFEDFIAVAEDLCERNITSPAHLGINGASNGGLLTAAVMVRRPDLVNAVITEVPLLDMLRYHLFPPGASWIGEYGDPTVPDEAAYLASYSPYHNLKNGVDYPSPFIVTSSKDDRVHPAHARKFAKRLEEFGQDFFYYEELDGGHGGQVNNRHQARLRALEKVYLWRRLMP